MRDYGQGLGTERLGTEGLGTKGLGTKGLGTKGLGTKGLGTEGLGTRQTLVVLSSRRSAAGASALWAVDVHVAMRRLDPEGDPDTRSLRSLLRDDKLAALLVPGP